MANHIEEFFRGYPRFTYDPTRSATDELYRLFAVYRWKGRNNAAKTEARAGFKDALVMEFNRVYGTDNSDLQSWQALCCVLGIAPVPDSLKTCRKRVKNAHVNLVDLVDIRNLTGGITVFPTEKALSEYTQSTGKYFPIDNARSGSLLKYLLRQIMDPRAESRARGRHGRG